jgi:hypothetical protein
VLKWFYDKKRDDLIQREHMATVAEEIRRIVEQLSLPHQQLVLEYAQGLTHIYSASGQPITVTPLPPGISGSALLHFSVPIEDAEAMELALQDCERIELDA